MTNFADSVYMSKFTKHIWRVFGKVFFPHFCNDSYINSTLLKFIFWQKILRINGSVPWPVHFTSKVIDAQKVDNDGGMRAPGYAMGCYIDGRGGITIEEGVLIGPKVSLISTNHNETDYSQYVTKGKIILHRHCWVATGATILSGVELGEHTIVAAGSVVTHSFTEGNCLIGGNPAVIIKKLEPYNGKAQRHI
ncbi:MAG: acyltransferase [Paludibacteraceae bacterium]|nr:acyltransferase [Paludibacteraceae bacterium]